MNHLLLALCFPPKFKPSLQFGSASVCSHSFVVYIEAKAHMSYVTEPLPLLSGFRLEFSVSTVDSGLEYDSKYRMIVEGRSKTERSNTSRAFPLSKYLCTIALLLQHTPLRTSLLQRPFTNI